VSAITGRESGNQTTETHMKSARSGLKVRTSVKAGGVSNQHNRRVLKVTTGEGGRDEPSTQSAATPRNARG
jgi:hypothetical protein